MYSKIHFSSLLLIVVLAFAIDRSLGFECSVNNSTVCANAKTCCPIKNGVCCDNSDYCCPQGKLDFEKN